MPEDVPDAVIQARWAERLRQRFVKAAINLDRKDLVPQIEAASADFLCKHSGRDPRHVRWPRPAATAPKGEEPPLGA